MPRHSLDIIWIRIVTAVAVLFAGCCKDSACPDTVESEPDEIAVYMRFRMGLANSGVSVSRAAGQLPEGELPCETPGTSREDAIERVDLLVADAESDKLLYVFPLMDSQVAQIVGTEGTVIPLFAEEGQRLHIYAAVNMPDVVRSQFARETVAGEISLRSDKTGYRDVMNELIPGSGGRQETLENGVTGTMPMSGWFTNAADGSRVITVTSDMTAQNPPVLAADVSRMVAKVHVLAATHDGVSAGGETVEYAYAENRKVQPAENIGWVRLSDVRYMLNGTNKSTYVFPLPTGRDAYPLWQDLNMDLDRYVAGQRNVELEFDESYNADFTFCEELDLHKTNISADGCMTPVEAFDETTFANTKSGADVPDRYAKGMYCMENYFDTPIAYAASMAAYEYAMPMVTHVSIAAKLIPRWIVVPKDFETQMDSFVEEYEFNPEIFRTTHGLSADDFTDDDAARWRAIKNDADYRKYFTDAEYESRSFRRIELKDEADASDIINWSLKMNHQWCADAADFFTTGKYPDGTFYVYDTDYDAAHIEPKWNQRYLYLTAGAVAKANDADVTIKSRSVPHLGGWGYYCTYIDHTGETKEGRTPYTASQVTRNTYYIVKVDNFGSPGGTITRPEYIKVNTQPVGWDCGGRGDISLH